MQTIRPIPVHEVLVATVGLCETLLQYETPQLVSLLPVAEEDLRTDESRHERDSERENGGASNFMFAQNFSSINDARGHVLDDSRFIPLL